ncbi:MAG: stage V sporulation protein AD [Lachnospiraceae bacterium]|nr:stage V sporulation protein AD [Lachnospiraceae bacterium]
MCEFVNYGLQMGKQSICFEKPVYIMSSACIVGPKEGEGPLKDTFDKIVEDATFGKDSWEEGESEMLKETVLLAIDKAKLKPTDIRYLFAGDLLGQLIATTFGVKDINIPLFGLYGACSTMGEALALGAMTIHGGYANAVVTAVSSHFGGAEKQFRFPLEYGNQRPMSSTWTVTGSGALVLSKDFGDVMITGITTGKVVDYGVKDSLNMGACMAPAAADLIYQHLKDFDRTTDYYDRIVTGDLGVVGSEILCKLLNDQGVDISKVHMDCGMAIYDDERQDTHAGGSGCACSAVTLAGKLLNEIKFGETERILFVPTGALLSTVSFNEGQSVPGIAHGIVIERRVQTVD